MHLPSISEDKQVQVSFYHQCMVTVHHNIAAAATMHKAFLLALVVALVLFSETNADSIQRIHRKHHKIQHPYQSAYQARAQQENFYFDDDNYGNFDNAYGEDFEDDFAVEGDYEIEEYNHYSDADFGDAYSDQSDAYDAADEYYDFSDADFDDDFEVDYNDDDDNSEAYAAEEYYDDAEFESESEFESAVESVSSARVVVSKEGPPPSPQEYTISKLEEPVVCAERGDATWKKWAKYDLDGVCARIAYYGEIEGQCETDCDLLCPQGFYEVAKEPCHGIDHFTGAVHGQQGYYRRCVGRYKCTQSHYDYWVNMKWWQFLIWEVVIVTLGCCFFGLAVGCCIRCCNNRGRPRGRSGNRNGGASSNSANNGANNGRLGPRSASEHANLSQVVDVNSPNE